MRNFLDNKTVSKVITIVLSVTFIACFLYVGKAEAMMKGDNTLSIELFKQNINRNSIAELVHQKQVICDYSLQHFYVTNVVRLADGTYTFDIRSGDTVAHCTWK